MAVSPTMSRKKQRSMRTASEVQTEVFMVFIQVIPACNADSLFVSRTEVVPACDADSLFVSHTDNPSCVTLTVCLCLVHR